MANLSAFAICDVPTAPVCAITAPVSSANFAGPVIGFSARVPLSFDPKTGSGARLASASFMICVGVSFDGKSAGFAICVSVGAPIVEGGNTGPVGVGITRRGPTASGFGAATTDVAGIVGAGAGVATGGLRRFAKIPLGFGAAGVLTGATGALAVTGVGGLRSLSKTPINFYLPTAYSVLFGSR